MRYSTNDTVKAIGLIVSALILFLVTTTEEPLWLLGAFISPFGVLIIMCGGVEFKVSNGHLEKSRFGRVTQICKVEKLQLLTFFGFSVAELKDDNNGLFLISVLSPSKKHQLLVELASLTDKQVFSTSIEVIKKNTSCYLKMIGYALMGVVGTTIIYSNSLGVTKSFPEINEIQVLTGKLEKVRLDKKVTISIKNDKNEYILPTRIGNLKQYYSYMSDREGQIIEIGVRKSLLQNPSLKGENNRIIVWQFSIDDLSVSLNDIRQVWINSQSRYFSIAIGIIFVFYSFISFVKTKRILS